MTRTHLPPQGALCQERGLGGMGLSQRQEFPMLSIIKVFPSPLEAQGPSHLGRPLKEPAAAPTAQRGCHLLERLCQVPLVQHPLGRTWGAAASLRQKQAADCLWVPRNNFLPSYSSLRGAILCHPGSPSRRWTNSTRCRLLFPSPKDAKGQNHHAPTQHFIRPVAMTLRTSWDTCLPTQ